MPNFFEETKKTIAHLKKRQADAFDYVNQQLTHFGGDLSGLAQLYFAEYKAWFNGKTHATQSSTTFSFSTEASPGVDKRIFSAFLKEMEEISKAYCEFNQEIDRFVAVNQSALGEEFRSIDKFCAAISQHASTLTRTNIEPANQFLAADSIFLRSSTLGRQDRLAWDVEDLLITASLAIPEVVIYYRENVEQYRLYINGEDYTGKPDRADHLIFSTNKDLNDAAKKIADLQSAISVYEKLEQWVTDCDGEDNLETFITQSNELIQKIQPLVSSDSSNVTLSNCVCPISFDPEETGSATRITSAWNSFCGSVGTIFTGDPDLEIGKKIGALTTVKDKVAQTVQLCETERKKIDADFKIIVNRDLNEFRNELSKGVNAFKAWLDTYLIIRAKLEKNYLTISQLKTYSRNLHNKVKELQENLETQNKRLTMALPFMAHVNQYYGPDKPKKHLKYKVAKSFGQKSTEPNSEAPPPATLMLEISRQDISCEDIEETFSTDLQSVKNNAALQKDVRERKEKRQPVAILSELPSLSSRPSPAFKPRQKLGIFEKYALLTSSLTVGALLEIIALTFLFPEATTWFLVAGVGMMLVIVLLVESKNNTVKGDVAQQVENGDGMVDEPELTEGIFEQLKDLNKPENVFQTNTLVFSQPPSNTASTILPSESEDVNKCPEAELN